jgi:hypothetical protein
LWEKRVTATRRDTEVVMSDQGNEKPAVETESAEEVEGHMRPKWHAIEEEPPADGSGDEVEGHMRPKWHAIEEEPAAESTDDDDDVEGHMRPKWH